MRLITRASLDGVACAVLITTMENIEQVVYAEPKEIEDDSVLVKPLDAIANLPYHRNCSMWFDHHDKAENDPGAKPNIKGKRGKAPSCARLVYEYYDSPRLAKYRELLEANDKIAQAHLTAAEVLNPEGWLLLAFTLDRMMGMEQFSGYANGLVTSIKAGANIANLITSPEVRSRVSRYLLDVEDFKEELSDISHLEGNVIISDLRRTDLLPAGNRFIIFGLYPEASVGIRIMPHSDPSKLALRFSKSIFRHSSNAHLGQIAAEYGGGGLEGAAGCVIPIADADKTINHIVDRLQEE